MSEGTLVNSQSAYDVLTQLKGQQASKYATDKAVAQVTKVGDWVPYLGLMQASSNDCKEHGFPIGHFALCRNRKKIDIGKSIIALMLSWRPKAMIYSPAVKSYYNPESDIFKKVEVDSLQPQSSRGFGPEFLLWLPDIEGGLFATLFFGNATGRVEAPNLLAAFERGELPCRLTSELIKDKKKNTSWHGVRHAKYEIDITNMPPVDTLNVRLEGFRNPPESEEEPAEEASGSERG